MSYVMLKNEDGIGVVTLNRPPANSFNLDMYRQIKETFDEVNKSNKIRVVVIRAEGKFFSAGNDVNDFNQADLLDSGYGDIVEAGLAAILKSKVPVISAVQGIAVGSGFCVPAYSDIVIASPEAKFGITEIKVGIIGGSSEASFVLPPKIVRYMALTGNLLSAEEMEKYSFVLKIVPRDKLFDTAMDIGQVVIKNPPISLQLMKQSLNNIYRPDLLAEKIAFDGERTAESIKTEDFKEAVKAFLEKREPVYRCR